jgi:hypothetical protein
MIRKIPVAQCKHKLISKKNVLFLEVDIILNLTSKIMPLYLEVGRHKAGIADDRQMVLWTFAVSGALQV